VCSMQGPEGRERRTVVVPSNNVWLIQAETEFDLFKFSDHSEPGMPAAQWRAFCFSSIFARWPTGDHRRRPACSSVRVPDDSTCAAEPMRGGARGGVNRHPQVHLRPLLRYRFRHSSARSVQPNASPLQARQNQESDLPPRHIRNHLHRAQHSHLGGIRRPVGTARVPVKQLSARKY
jgi:hypothetical protein